MREPLLEALAVAFCALILCSRAWLLAPESEIAYPAIYRARADQGERR